MFHNGDSSPLWNPLAVRRRLRNVESFLGSKRGVYSRGRIANSRKVKEREGESGERSRVTSVPTASIRDQTVWQPFVTSGEQLRGEYSKFIVDYYQNSRHSCLQALLTSTYVIRREPRTEFRPVLYYCVLNSCLPLAVSVSSKF